MRNRLARSGFWLLFAATVLLPGSALAAADPVDNLLTNALALVQSWGSKAALIYLVFGFLSVAWASRENNPEMRGSAWRHVMAGIIAFLGCQLAPTIARMFLDMTN